MRSTWEGTRYLAVAQTSVTSAVSFTDWLEEDYEPRWRAFWFKNSEYAARFRNANASQLWDFRSAGALAAKQKRARRSRWQKRLMPFAGVAIVLSFLWWFYEEAISPVLHGR